MWPCAIVSDIPNISESLCPCHIFKTLLTFILTPLQCPVPKKLPHVIIQLELLKSLIHPTFCQTLVIIKAKNNSPLGRKRFIIKTKSFIGLEVGAMAIHLFPPNQNNCFTHPIQSMALFQHTFQSLRTLYYHEMEEEQAQQR